MDTCPRKLLDQVRDQTRLKHYSYRTEQTYVYWIRRYILFHNKRHPAEMGGFELEGFLTHLATVGKVTASTQNQALNAIIFLYRHVLKQDLGSARFRSKDMARFIYPSLSRAQSRRTRGA